MAVKPKKSVKFNIPKPFEVGLMKKSVKIKVPKPYEVGLMLPGASETVKKTKAQGSRHGGNVVDYSWNPSDDRMNFPMERKTKK